MAYSQAALKHWGETISPPEATVYLYFSLKFVLGAFLLEGISGEFQRRAFPFMCHMSLPLLCWSAQTSKASIIGYLEDLSCFPCHCCLCFPRAVHQGTLTVVRFTCAHLRSRGRYFHLKVKTYQATNQAVKSFKYLTVLFAWLCSCSYLYRLHYYLAMHENGVRF